MLSLKRLVILTALSLLCIPAMDAVQPKAEVRSMWIATVWQIDWPQSAGTSTSVANSQKQQMSTIIRDMATGNYNALYFQVRPNCDAFYKSKYEPWSNYLTGSRGAAPAYDPLAYVVEQCHANEMECHAWVNPMRFSTGSNYTTPNDNDMKNRGWLLKHGNTTIMNPGIPEVRQRIVDVCRDIIENYDVDGIVFDDYFYPSNIPTNSSAGDYNLWKKSGTPNFADWRRENVNKVIKQVYDMIQQVKPYVKFGVSPRGIAGTSQKVADKYGVPRCTSGSDSQYDQIFCDPLAWLQAGSVDYISPQIYWARGYSAGDFSILCPWWANVADKFNRHFYTSHSLEYFKDSQKTSREKNFAGMAAQVRINRDVTENNAPGAIFYSYSCIKDKKENSKSYFDYLGENVFSTKALTPAISWKNAPAQGKVQNLRLTRIQLSWDKVDNVRYAVYALPARTAHEARNLKAEYLVAHLYNNKVNLTASQIKGEIAVTIVDRYGNEYAPQWLDDVSDVEKIETEDLAMTIADGQVFFNQKMDLVEVYDTQGKLVADGKNCESINLRNFSGIAFVKMTYNGLVKTVKSLVE